jgi:hypothetical protein
MLQDGPGSGGTEDDGDDGEDDKPEKRRCGGNDRRDDAGGTTGARPSSLREAFHCQPDMPMARTGTEPCSVW